MELKFQSPSGESAAQVRKTGGQDQQRKIMQPTVPPRSRGAKRRLWIVGLVSMVFLSVLAACIYPPTLLRVCPLFCGTGVPQLQMLPPPPPRILSDQELSTRVFVRDIVSMPVNLTVTAKIAFMFLTRGPLPLVELWEEFFRGHEGKFSIYVHVSQLSTLKTAWKSPLFDNHDIRSQKVDWGTVSMVDAERRLLTNALQDPDNQHFVLLSESCIPVRSFDFVYDYLMGRNVSFVDCFDDPGPHGRGRYTKSFFPEIRVDEWRKGSQWFTVKRQHALLIVADYVYYSKFKHICRPGAETHNCYPDEHYVQTFLHMMDPSGITNWSVTHVDWSEGKWHPKMYNKKDVNIKLLKKIQAIGVSAHVSSDLKKQQTIRPCMVNGERKPCHLFARKYASETLNILLNLFPNITKT